MIRFRSLGAALFLVVSASPLVAQTVVSKGGGADTLKIATYNILNYPGSTGSIRNPHFRAVLHALKPDILIVQEMTSQAGSDQFLSEVMNKYQPGLYAAPAFHNGPDTDCQLYYRPDKVTFLRAAYLLNTPREIAEYVVQNNVTGDTLRLYGVHFKASQGYENDRLAEATRLRNHLDSLPSGSRFVIAGDFNMYTSEELEEPGFQKLIGEPASNGRAKDPLNAFGNWHDDSTFARFHTQSTRDSSFGGGAIGGMDDWFDKILPSSSDTNIVISSWIAYGNDSFHFNKRINRPQNQTVPDSVADGLHNASDHIPWVCILFFPIRSPDTTVTIHIPISNRWNMLSVPVAQADTPKTALFPTSVSDAFVYSQSYVPKDSLRNGPGFWLKFTADDTVEITGRPLHLDTLSVVGGWNMIGSISDSVDVDDVVTDPIGIITSQFFGYSGSYAPTTYIVPGQGYWVKVNQQGKIILKKR